MLFFGLFLILLFLGVPVAVSLGAAAVFLSWKYELGISSLSMNFYANVAKFQLLAIPFFILAGLVLDRCGISRRLVRFVSLLVGPIPGGLALVTIIVGLLFAGISGSGPADTAALCTVLIPAMAALGYGTGFTAALAASCGSFAIVVPPSIAFILYGVITSTSVPALFAAGVIPGILVGLFLMIPSYVIARRRGWKGERWGTRAELWQAFRQAFWGLAAPFIILGGIYGGIVTPTEAAVVAVVYGLAIGALVYRTLTLRTLYAVFRDAVVSSAVVMIIVAFAGLYAWAGSTMGVMDKVSKAALSLTSSPALTLLLINVALLLAGMFLDAISIYYIFLPMLIPVIAHFHWDPVWFGVVMTLNLAIGQITPPVAVNLYVAAHTGGVSVEETSRSIWPFLLAMCAALAIVTCLPFLSTWLPTLLELSGE